MGVDNDDLEDVAMLVGIKTVVNEFQAYKAMLDNDAIQVRYFKLINPYTIDLIGKDESNHHIRSMRVF